MYLHAYNADTPDPPLLYEARKPYKKTKDEKLLILFKLQIYNQFK